MYCKTCGALIDDTSKFCEYCGAKVEIKSQSSTTKKTNNNDQYFDSRTERYGRTTINNFNEGNHVERTGSTSPIIGILALVFTFIPTFFIIGFVLALSGMSTYKDNKQAGNYKLCKAAFIIQMIFIVAFIAIVAFVFIASGIETS